MRTIALTITAAEDGRQIRDVLRRFGVSTALLKKLKQSPDGILLNGCFAKTIACVHTGDVLQLCLADSGSMPPRLENSGVRLCYTDEDVCVLNKPAYMPVHESRNHRGDSLANAAACFYSGTAFRAVYRLDRNTSGLVVTAKNELAAAKLAGRVEKEYYAVCTGILEGAGTLDFPIRRVQDSIITRGVFADGVRAVTHWQALRHSRGHTLVRLRLETGRTHQIRVHFAHIGHPLLGDALYGGDCTEIKRQALHCKTIRFLQPVTGEAIAVDSALPPDFQALLQE